MPVEKRLGDIAHIIPGIPEDKPAVQDFTRVRADVEYCYIQPNNLTEDGRIQEPTFIWKKEQVQRSQLVQNGDVLIKRLNHSDAVLVSGITKPTVISPNLFIIRSFAAVVPEYLACLLERAGILRQIEHISGTSVSVKTLSAKKLAEIMIPVIPVKNQRILGEVWKLSKRKKRLLQSYIQESDNFLSALVNRLTVSK